MGGSSSSRYHGEIVNGKFVTYQITFSPLVTITGEKRLILQNAGYGTCAVAYKTGFLTIGGLGGAIGAFADHGKVDRCLIHHIMIMIRDDIHDHQSLSVPGTTLKANTWVPFPTWPHLEMGTPAQVFSPTTASR